MLTDDRSRVLRTMPADLHATPGYLAVNPHPHGIAPETAERAAWRAPEAHRFEVEPGFVLLAIAPPEHPGGRARNRPVAKQPGQNGHRARA